jgi:alpha-D-ribose 1-methylphosphonate 5-triphosphate synthase subunit PhnG|tara:strand:+ start:4019 stop:4456 length:438 start_codon:yes stop_codon:yes gene_type:complete
MNKLSRGERSELLAATDPDLLTAIGNLCLEGTDNPEIITGPQVGTVVLTLREPIEEKRFHLGEVLATKTEVIHRGIQGWALLMGDNPVASLAAAICDAEIEANGPYSTDVETLLRETKQKIQSQRAAEWQELSATIVNFEEIESK